MKNEIIFDNESVSPLKKGAEKVYKAVSGTIGAAGKNVIYREYGRPIITNDGVSIARRINLKDEAESIGADLIKQAAERTDEEAGDGTSTAIVLSYNIMNEGLLKIAAGANAMKLRREINVAVKKIVEELKAKARPVASDEELFNIANISVEDPEIATIVRDAVKKAGIDGTVIVDESTGITIEKEEVEGLRFDKGFVSPYMINNPEKMQAVLDESKDKFGILVTDKNFNMITDVLPLLEQMAKDGIRNLLLIAEDVSGELLATLIRNKMEGRFNVIAVKKPYYKETLDDIAVLTGATALTSEKGIQTLKAEHVQSLGRAKRVIVTKDSCIIAGGYGKKEDIEERIASIKLEIKGAENYEKNKLKDRLARLVGGVVHIKVGAPTEAEMKYTKRKIDDAVNATRAAMEEGVVIGGGRTMLDLSLAKADTVGEQVVRKALAFPIRRIIENAGENADKVIATLKEGEVFDALNGVVCSDPIQAGIIDPVKVERSALVNAASFAANFLTHHATIVDEEEKDKNYRPDMV